MQIFGRRGGVDEPFVLGRIHRRRPSSMRTGQEPMHHSQEASSETVYIVSIPACPFFIPVHGGSASRTWHVLFTSTSRSGHVRVVSPFAVASGSHASSRRLEPTSSAISSRPRVFRGGERRATWHPRLAGNLGVTFRPRQHVSATCSSRSCRTRILDAIRIRTRSIDQSMRGCGIVGNGSRGGDAAVHGLRRWWIEASNPCA